MSLAAVGEQVVLQGGGGRGRHKEACVDYSTGDDAQGLGAVRRERHDGSSASGETATSGGV